MQTRNRGVTLVPATLLLLTSCGGSQSAATATATATVATGESAACDIAPLESADVAIRRAFRNPGGMWMPEQLAEQADLLRGLGLAIEPATLADPLAAPLGAVVSLGGCSASFVSADGLVITNHHCVQGALQYNSTPEQNLLEHGFLAATRADERSNGPASRVYVAQAIRDVTAEMRGGLEAIADPVARKEEAERRNKRIVAACEKDRPELNCRVSSYFRGASHRLVEYLELRDVRLVHAPPRSVGNYGGEIDNWAWPRHTGDYSFYRAYVGPDGKPADFAAANVPYRPRHFLKIAKQGLRAGDLVMVVGYPGHTDRLATAAELRHDVEFGYPKSIAASQARYDALARLLGAGGETALKASMFKQGAQNRLEKNQGVLAGLERGDLLAEKAAVDAKVRSWVVAQPDRKAWADALVRLDVILANEEKTALPDFHRGQVFGGSSLLSTAFGLVRMAEERPKADEERKPGYQARDLARSLAEQRQAVRRYDRTIDRALFRVVLVAALELPELERPWLATLVGSRAGKKVDEKTIDLALERLYAGTKLESADVRVALYEKASSAELAKSKDPFVRAALALWPQVKAEEREDDAVAGELLLVAPAYAEALREMLGGRLAPDANSSLRITFGTVRPFEPGVVAGGERPFTLATEILAKDTGKDPFDAPAAELEAIRQKTFGPYADPALGDCPVDFLSDLDITGGNSGSPTLDARGELVGLAFDGTLEGVSSDVIFAGARTRTIHADIRYVLWYMDLLAGADDLLREMGVEPALPAAPTAAN